MKNNSEERTSHYHAKKYQQHITGRLSWQLRQQTQDKKRKMYPMETDRWSGRHRQRGEELTREQRDREVRNTQGNRETEGRGTDKRKERDRWGQAALDTASFFRWSMKTCRLTSSVRMGAPDSCTRRHCNQSVSIQTENEVKVSDTHLTPGVHVVVGLRRVHFGQQKTGLESTWHQQRTSSVLTYCSASSQSIGLK